MPSRPHSHRRQPQRGKPPQKQERPDDPVTAAVLAAADAALGELGPALDAQLYRDLLVSRLKRGNHQVQVRPKSTVKHRDRVADQLEAELVVDQALAVAVQQAPAGFSPTLLAEMNSWMKQWNLPNSLALDFSTHSVQAKRLHLVTPPFPEIPLGELMHGAPVEPTQQPQASMVCRAVLRVGRGHGLGFREATYRGLLKAEFDADGFDSTMEPLAPVKTSAGILAEIPTANCLVVQRAGLLMPLALREGITATDRAIFQAALRRLSLPWGLIAHYGRRRFEWIWQANGKS